MPREREDLTALPLWAQRRIAKLTMEVHDLTIAVNTAAGTMPKSPVELQPSGFLSADRPPTYLATEAKLRFLIGDNPHRQDWIEVSYPLGSRGKVGDDYQRASARYRNVIQVRGSTGIVPIFDASNSALITLPHFLPNVVKDGLV